MQDIILAVVALCSFVIGSLMSFFCGVLCTQMFMKNKKSKSVQNNLDFPVYETVELKEQTEIVDMSSNVAYGNVNP